MVTKIKRTVVVDENGFVVKVSSEPCEWSPPISSRPSHLVSKSILELRDLKAGETKKIVHPDVSCHIREVNGQTTTTRACSLLPQLTKLRKEGWIVEQYHEADHIIVVRRLQ